MTPSEPFKKRDPEELVDEVMTQWPKSGAEFDSYGGWTMPCDRYESNVPQTLKEVAAALAGEGNPLSEAVYDSAERLLYQWQVFVMQGVRENFGNHKGVSWYLVEKGERCLISYQDGAAAEWFNEAYANEVPLWLLLELIRRIIVRMPRGEQDAYDTDGTLRKAIDEFVSVKERQDAERNLGRLNFEGEDDQ
jgi:hypothetical protein